MKPETLSRLLAAWRDKGIVESRGRELLIQDVAALEEIADGAA